jgi:WD40 repeat protein
VPRANSSFLIGSNEVFNKPLDTLTLNAEWADLPETNFKTHYQEYKQDGDAIVLGNEYFTAGGYLLAEGEWQPLAMQYEKEGTSEIDLNPKVNAVAYSRNYQRIATSHDGGLVRIRATASGILVQTLELEKSLKKNKLKLGALQFSPDGEYIAALTSGGLAVIWKIDSGRATAYGAPDKVGLNSIAFDNRGVRIATARDDGSVLVWNVDKNNIGKTPLAKQPGNKKYQLTHAGDGAVHDVSFSPNGSKLCAALQTGELVIVDLRSGKQSALSAHSAAVKYCEYSADGQWIASVSDDGQAILWNAREEVAIYKLDSHQDEVVAASFSGDGKYLLTGHKSGLVTLWLTRGGLALASYEFGSGLFDVKLHGGKMGLLVVIQRVKLSKMVVMQLQPTDDGQLFLPKGAEKKPLAARSFYIEPSEGAIAFNPQQSFTRFSNNLRQGFLRLQLDHSFLQEMYPKLIAEAALPGGTGTVPNAPYVPMMASLSVDYTATQVVNYGEMKLADFEGRIEQLFHLSPFGFSEVFPIADQANPGKVLVDRHLVPHFPVTVTAEDESQTEEMAEGTLYIGIEKLQPAQNLSILFQLAEGSEAKDLPAQPVIWSYLSNNRWVDFDSDEIITERTNGLLTSGIIEFAMPKEMSSGDSMLPEASSGGLHWIKASVYENSAAVCKLIALHTQAALASFRDHNNDPSHLQTALAAQTIAKLKSRIAAIKSVAQPYASFGGKMAESDTEFQVRVSERLRHKGRAVTLFDYERLVLEAFPEVYKVKCINHTSLTSEHQPGAVKLIVVPDLRNKNAVDPFAPRLSLNKRESIKKFLQALVSDFVQIEVSDPQYEEIYVDFKVRFKQGVDKGFYQILLNKEIINFLSPWLTDEGADLQFGGRIHRSVILKYIEDRSYVEFITDFRMDRFIDGVVEEDIEIATASTSSSVLVSARQHGVDPEAESCEDREATAVASSGVVPAPKASADEVTAYRYLGNRRSREMHDLQHIKGACQIDEIDEKWRLYFSTTEEGKGMGFDYCAYCFGKDLSKK